jgi:hypothetical protein
VHIRIGELGLGIISYLLFQYNNYFLCNILSDFLCFLLYLMFRLVFLI